MQTLSDKLRTEASATRQTLESEMDSAEQTVAHASHRIEILVTQAKSTMSQAQLDVHAAIFDASMALVRLIQELVQRAGQLQNEIVSREAGDGSALATAQFYKRNSRWVEGLMSAAKAVGAGASVLVDNANAVVQGEAKFEELMVAGHEIAASTAQLVSASRVKASNTSKHMQPLEQTSRQVSDATKALIAAAREAGKQSQTPISAQDYLKMSLPQARRLEMELQVRVIELEATLSRERERLGQVRRANYHKSGDSQA
eukprot:m.373595 g.373595  ORF g.373595 m.373595 type:complete len:258 (-) comp19998_c2_seq19:712-1485(-)